MTARGYKKYMKKDSQQSSPILKIFIVTFFGMLLVFTFIFKSLAPSVDTSIGDYKETSVDIEEPKKIVDDRLQMIQSEDQGKSFSELMSKPDDVVREEQPAVAVEQNVNISQSPEKSHLRFFFYIRESINLRENTIHVY